MRALRNLVALIVAIVGCIAITIGTQTNDYGTFGIGVVLAIVGFLMAD